jgi:hypothetical protein
MAFYGGLIVWTGDLGGPLNLVIIPVMSAIIGLGISLVAFLPLSLLAERFGFRRWLQTVGGLSAALAGVVVLAWIFIVSMKLQNHWLRTFLVVGGLCIYLTGGLFVYMCCLAICKKMQSPV